MKMLIQLCVCREFCDLANSVLIVVGFWILCLYHGFFYGFFYYPNLSRYDLKDHWQKVSDKDKKYDDIEVGFGRTNEREEAS